MTTLKQFGALKYDREGLTGLSLVHLTQMYNKLAESPVKGFRDKPTAVDRVWALGKEVAAPKAAVKPVRERQVKASGEKKERQQGARGSAAFPNDAKIIILTDTNPRREGSKTHFKFDLLMKYSKKTVGEFRSLEGKTKEADDGSKWALEELRYAVNNGYAKLEPARAS